MVKKALAHIQIFLVLESEEKKSVGATQIGAYLCIKPRESKNALHSVGSRLDQGTALQLKVD